MSFVDRRKFFTNHQTLGGNWAVCVYEEWEGRDNRTYQALLNRSYHRNAVAAHDKCCRLLDEGIPLKGILR